MFNRANRSPFAGGVICGLAIALTVFVLMGQGPGGSGDGDTEFNPERLFVTGGVASATVWRLEPDGTLTCVSSNRCNVPEYPPPDERIAPRDPSVPRGRRTPPGPAVPPTLPPRDE